jgi:DNA primase catalytic core
VTALANPQVYRPPAAAGLDVARLYEVNAAAAAFYAGLLDSHQPAMTYLREHGISNAARAPWQLGYAPPGWHGLVNHLRAQRFTDDEIYAAGLAHGRHGQLLDRFRDRVVFPVHDQRTRVVGFTARDLSCDPDAPKYLNTPQTRLYHKSELLYGLGVQLRHPPRGEHAALVIIVEGAADAVATWQMSQSAASGLSTKRMYAVAPCGAALTEAQLRLLQESLPGAGLAVAFDGDRAGRHAFLRIYPLLRRWPGERYAITLPDGLDPAELSAVHGPAGGLAELTERMVPSAWMALASELDQLIDHGRITRPREWAEDRLLAYQAIAGYFIDAPEEVSELAQVAAQRLGLTEGEVVRGVVENIFPADPDEPNLPRRLADQPETTTSSSQQWRSPARSVTVDRAHLPGRQPPPMPEQDRTAQDVVAALAARQGRRSVQADANATSIDPATGRRAWAVADGIGDTQQAAHAASTAAQVAAQIAARSTAPAGIAAAGATLNSHGGDGDAAIVVATAHPTGQGARFELAWAGNARAYTRLGEQLIQVTTDYTVAQQQRDNGRTVAPGSQLEHLLTASARGGPVGRATIDVPPSGALLLCTAGVHHHLDPAHLRQALGPVRSPTATTTWLLNAAAGGRNATVVLLHTSAALNTGPRHPARLARLAGAAAHTSHQIQPQHPPPPPAHAGTPQLLSYLGSLLGTDPPQAAGSRRH